MNYFDFDNDKVLNVYAYGSRVYGNCTDKSDYDYIIVVADDIDELQIKESNKDATVYSEKKFQKLLYEHDVCALECFYLEKKHVIKQTKQFSFNLDILTLRKSFSKVASNSFVKAKKKLTVEKDYNPYIAKKSLFHSLRIILFGIQIAEFGRILDYSEGKEYWKDIIFNESNEWEYYKVNYQSIYNNIKSTFREITNNK